MSAGERKEWLRVSHSPTSTLVTVTLQSGSLSVRWSVKTYPSELRAGVASARAGAEKALTELEAIVAEAT